MKWEYKYIYVCHKWSGEGYINKDGHFVVTKPANKENKIKEVEKNLNEIGKEGWELVYIDEGFLEDIESVDTYVLCKRQVKE